MLASEGQTRLHRRIQELEQRVEQLRFSHRVLLRLMEKSEAEKWEMINRLKAEKEKIEKRNRHYARMLWEKNKELVRLSSLLEEVSAK